MAEKNYQDAVQALRQQFGGRWEGNEADGRSEMAKILRDALGFSAAEADDTITAMVTSNKIRYHTTAEETGRPVAAPPLTPPGEGMVTGVPAGGGMGGMPLAPGMLPATGFWEVGDGSSDGEVAPGRSGQVTPDGL